MNIARVFLVFTPLLLFSTASYSQSLFESASNDSSSTENSQAIPKVVDLSGFVKGAIFGGSDNNNDPLISGVYAQTALKLSANKGDKGSLFTEIRLTAGKVHDKESAAVDVREAWGKISMKNIDIKLGRQIIVWGRADAINPTNNITPKNELVLSSEYDDTRLGNELLQLKVRIGSSSVQGLWIPYYRSDILLVNSSIMPSGVTFTEPYYPDYHFTNGGFALRLDLVGSSLDGSISYFNGYGTMPGFDYSLGLSGMSLIPRAYRMQVAGGDISTAIGSVGLRAEVAAKLPIDEYRDQPYIPNPYLQFVVGVDKSIGDWSFLFQYSGLYVIDYEEVNEPVLLNPQDPFVEQYYSAAVAKSEIERMNRLFTGTSDEFTNSVTANIQWSAMHETLHLKLAGFYNITTEEYALVPDLTYDFADAVSLTIGGRYLDGKNETMNNLVSDLMSNVFTEFKFSF